MTKQPTTLEQRIDFALQPDTAVTSADLAALMEEAESGIAKAEKEREIDQTLALDPKAARQKIADASFVANRLRTLLSKLQARSQQVRDEEERTACLAKLDEKKSESMAAAFAGTAMASYDRRFTADWAKENERRAAGQRVQQQYHADFLARLTREQEQRQNREALESFMEQQERLTRNRPLK